VHKEKGRLVKKAAAVIVISNATRRDLLRFHPEAAEKVHVVPLGSPPILETDWTDRSRGDFLLFIGERSRYKNFVRFSQAAVRMLRRNSDLRLVCVGGGPLTKEELEPFLLAGLGDRVTWENPTDDRLNGLYRRAALFVFPSWYEGFGLPLLEAMANGCPTAAARTEAFTEVAGDAAIYFDPFSTDEMEAAMETVLRDRATQQELVRNGLKRARLFSWRRMAEQTAEVYRSLAP